MNYFIKIGKNTKTFIKYNSVNCKLIFKKCLPFIICSNPYTLI